MPPLPKRPPLSLSQRLKGLGAVVRQAPRTLRMVWEADARGAVVVILLSVLAAVFPVAIAYVGKLIVDAVVQAAKSPGPEAERLVLRFVGLELLCLVGQTVVLRAQGLFRELLRARLGNLVNDRILQKALALDLRHFEDADTYDKMQNARREAASRPLSLAMQLLSIGQNVITLTAYAALLIRLSPIGVVVLFLASIPAFLTEAKLSAESFRLHSWRAPEGRKLNYLEWILTRDSHAKEVKLFGLGPLILGRYRTLFDKFFAEDRRLAMRRLVYGVTLGLISVVAFYGVYALVALQAARGQITLGDMVLYVSVFRQGQTAFQSILTSLGSMYEDALFMSNLFLFLDLPTGAQTEPAANGEEATLAAKRVFQTVPSGSSQRIEFRNVSFRYPGKEAWALRQLNLTLEPGEKLGLVGENGAGKSTLIKLLLRLYEPTEGAILYGGVDIRQMDPEDFRSRFGAVFQDFVRYQFSAAENVGLGAPAYLEDRPRIERAVERGGAAPVIEGLPQKLDTPLGGWFEQGQELSAGQWQKLAVSRGYMRDAEVLILDEPTASIDAEAEHEMFERFRALAADRTAIIISHRFSTVRMSDRIAVLHGGEIVELGSHRELLAQDGRYAHLFRLQARGYLEA